MEYICSGYLPDKKASLFPREQVINNSNLLWLICQSVKLVIRKVVGIRIQYKEGSGEARHELYLDIQRVSTGAADTVIVMRRKPPAKAGFARFSGSVA
jgi:hypothetical protein